MKYSFVLPAYKAAYFRKAIDSILNQTYTEFELIIVNDASPDDIDSIIRSYQDSRIKYYVNEHNIGGKDLVAQWNRSISYAKGEYLILASDDDVYFPEYLEKMDALVMKYPNVKVFRPRVQVVDGQDAILRVYGSLSEKVTPLEYWYHWNTVGSSIGHIVFERESLIEKGGFVNFPMAWGSDDATMLMLGSDGICFANEILYSFRNSGVNITSQINDYYALTKKIEAHRMFYNWMKDYLERYHASSDYDAFYKNVLLGELDELFQNLTLGFINYSSLYAVLRSLPNIFRLEYVSRLSVIKRIIWKFCRNK